MTLQAPRLLAATHNIDKLREIHQILAETGWEVVGLDSFPPYPEPPETGETLLENALIKAREGFRRTGMLTLADDTGLEVDALDGRPGVRSARYAGEKATYEDNVKLLLKELSSLNGSDRTARFRTVMALVGSGIEKWWEGVSEGRIINEARGANGFGYDPVFWSPDIGRTFAEASPAEKHSVSHRGRALRGLLDVLSGGPIQDGFINTSEKVRK